MTHDTEIQNVLNELAALAENEWLPPWARGRLHDIRTRVAALVEAAKQAEFDAHGYCLVCSGWNVSENGCTPRVHTRDCALSAALLPFKGEKS